MKNGNETNGIKPPVKNCITRPNKPSKDCTCLNNITDRLTKIPIAVRDIIKKNIVTKIITALKTERLAYQTNII